MFLKFEKNKTTKQQQQTHKQTLYIKQQDNLTSELTRQTEKNRQNQSSFHSSCRPKTYSVDSNLYQNNHNQITILFQGKQFKNSQIS